MKLLNPEQLESKAYKNGQAAGKRVLLRTCLNVATDLDGNMSDATRYHESFPLIKQLAGEVDFLLVTAHLGRPQAQESQFSFRKICEQLSQDLGKPVTFVTSLEQLNALTQQSGLTKQSGLFFLENVRFRPGEESKDAAQRMQFAQQLAQYADVFINDAFADYRESASTYDVATLLPSLIGPVFAREVRELNMLMKPNRPMVAILGGSKLSEKLDAMVALLQIADKVLVGGAMRYTLMKAQGISIGNSRVENDKLELATQLLTQYRDKIVLPTDHMIINQRGDPATVGYEYTDGMNIADGYEAIDIGPKGIQEFVSVIKTAKTIVWNGPMGVYERTTSAHGTNEIGKAIAGNADSYKLAGGGDSIAAINALGLDGFNHICTGGGAMLAYLGDDVFPTLDVIMGK